MQQPVGQIALLHVPPAQYPFVHWLPPAQAEHGFPPEPHAAAVCWVATRHPWAEQHPVQVALLQVPPQAPLTHWAPAAHVPHRLPPVPQALAVLPATHTPAAVQQPAQLAAVQLPVLPLHVPLEHVCPDGHSVHRSPPTPHAGGVVPATQMPFSVQHPAQLPTHPDFCESPAQPAPMPTMRTAIRHTL